MSVSAANETGGELNSSKLVRTASARSVGHVRRLVAYRSSGPPTVQTEPPTGGMSLILSMGPSMSVRWAGAPSQRVRSFLVGFFDRPAETADEGDAWGVQIDLTAAGAFALLGTQVADVENHLLDADLLDGLQPDRLVDQLASCPSAAQRLAIAERAVQDLFAAGPRLGPEVDWIERCLRADPTRRVRSLAAEVGWRAERLSQRFRQEVG